MSTLSDGELHRLIESGDIVIEPLRDPDLQIQPSSIDIHLGDEFLWFDTDVDAIDPRVHDIEDHMVSLTVPENESYTIDPGEFVLGTTDEWVEVPDFLKADVRGRSSFGRMGLIVHATAGLIDAGWCGEVTLELKNIADMPIKLYPGDRIGQLVFEQLESPSERPYGDRDDSKYQGQRGVQSSRLQQDFGVDD